MYREQYGEYTNWCSVVKGSLGRKMFGGWNIVLSEVAEKEMHRTCLREVTFWPECNAEMYYLCLLVSGQIMEDLAFKLLRVEPCKFQPTHARNLANKFACFVNYDSELDKWHRHFFLKINSLWILLHSSRPQILLHSKGMLFNFSSYWAKSCQWICSATISVESENCLWYILAKNRGTPFLTIEYNSSFLKSQSH